MAKILDFNTLERPVLEIVLRDDARTHIKVGTPTERMVEELNQIAPALNAAIDAANEDQAAATRAIYDLAARLINCNRSGIKVTADELLDKYRMDLESLVVFYGAYIDFINEVTQAKN